LRQLRLGPAIQLDCCHKHGCDNGQGNHGDSADDSRARPEARAVCGGAIALPGSCDEISSILSRWFGGAKGGDIVALRHDARAVRPWQTLAIAVAVHPTNVCRLLAPRLPLGGLIAILNRLFLWPRTLLLRAVALSARRPVCSV